MKGKIVESLEEAVRASGLKDGMTFSCHHHLRNGDKVMNLVCQSLEDMGFHDLTLNATSVHNAHAPLVKQIEHGVITQIISPYIGGDVGRAVSEGKMEKPAIFCTHGARPSDLEQGKTHIDVAFIAAPTADCMGNFTGKYGQAACGSMGYIFCDAQYADKVIVITDNLVDYPLADFSVSEVYVDYVVKIDCIGDPSRYCLQHHQYHQGSGCATDRGLCVKGNLCIWTFKERIWFPDRSWRCFSCNSGLSAGNHEKGKYTRKLLHWRHY